MRVPAVVHVVSRIAMIAVFAIFTLPSVVAAQLVSRGDEVYFLSGDDPQVSLKVRNITTGLEREVYRANLGRVFDFRVSTAGHMVAVVEQVLEYATEAQPGAPKDTVPVTENTTLHVLTRTGEFVDEVQQVRHFAWNPDGTRLVYVTGEYRGRDRDYGNTRTWIWNSVDKSRREISQRGYYVNWAAFDGNIYLWEKNRGIAGAVYRYSPATETLEATTHKSIYFSTTGTYYYHPGGGIGIPENVFLRSSDSPLKRSSQVLMNLAGWRPMGWARDDDRLLMEVSRRVQGLDGRSYDESATIIYDVTNDTSADVPPAQYVTWGNDSSEIIIKNGARIERRIVQRRP